MKKKCLVLGVILCMACTSLLHAQKEEVSISKSFTFYIDPNIEPPSEFIQKYVLDSVEIWQKKGRYETTAEYKARVTEENRQIYANRLAKDAEKQYLKKYYDKNISFELEDYDADSESFLLSSKIFGKIVLPVARASAEAFEKSWEVDDSGVELYVDGDEVRLKKVPFLSNGKVFVYDPAQSAVYAATRANVQLPALVLDLTPEEQYESQQQILDRTVTVGKSDVDIDIPVSNVKNDKTFAVIIANEDYKRVEDVPFALNDGKMFKEYCIKTLGIPKKNIHFVENATLNDLLIETSWICEVMETQNGEASVIYYYAGHGVPDESTKKAYLFPVDGYGSNYNSGYSLDELYKQLGNCPAKQVTFFIDACFSGSKREEGMLASARGVAIKAKEGVLTGKSVAFTASSDDQTAYPYQEKGHGMFTYFLLKKLNETSGNVTYQELGDYIVDQVKKYSLIENRKSQTPTIKANPALQDEWKEWKLK